MSKNNEKESSVTPKKLENVKTTTLKYILTASGPFLNLDRVIVITFSFFLMFTPFISCQAITPQIMNELGYGNVGFINLAIIYLTFGLTALLATPINRKLGHKFTLIISSSTYAIWAFAFILPAYKYENSEKLGNV